MSANFDTDAIPPTMSYQSKTGESTNTLTSGDKIVPAENPEATPDVDTTEIT